MKFRYERPNINRKKEAIEFINEFYEYGSKINGVGGLTSYLEDFEGWLKKLDEDYTREVTEDKVPARTYFFIRVDDNKIIGMTNIRTKLNQKLMNFGGNIGYCIRPTERGKGYNKVNLYLALKVCKECGIKKVLLDADKGNPASWRTMESFGAVLEEEKSVELYNEDVVRFYSIEVERSLELYGDVYGPLIESCVIGYMGDKAEVKVDRSYS